MPEVVGILGLLFLMSNFIFVGVRWVTKLYLVGWTRFSCPRVMSEKFQRVITAWVYEARLLYMANKIMVSIWIKRKLAYHLSMH